MAFPSLAEITSKAAVKPEAESAPAAESSVPTTVQSEPLQEQGGDTNTEQQVAPAEAVQDAQPSGSQDAEPAAESSEPGPIPYGRFKEKNEQVKTLRETNELLQQELERLKQAQVVEEKQPEPEAPDPILEKINSLDEYGSDSEMVTVMKDMAEELKTLRAKANSSQQGVQEIRVQKEIQKIESQISAVTEEVNVYDKAGARVFILQTLSKDPSQDVKALADQFSQWEKSQEQTILDRLGMKRPEAKKEAKEAEPDVPPRPATAGAKTGSPATSQKKPVTLKDLRKTLVSGRRR